MGAATHWEVSLEMPVESQKPSPGASAGRRLALVIGVNGQPAPGRAPLQHAVVDGQDMALVLKQSCCGFDLFRSPLLGEQATSGQLKDAVLDLAEELQDGDFALLFFSGHAEPQPLSGSDLDEVYLLTDDFDATRARRDPGRYVSLRWLREQLFEHPKAHALLFVFDCCYAGKFADSAPDPYLERLYAHLRHYFGEPGAQSPSRPGSVRLALTATGTSVAKEQNGHGLLTGYLLKALRGECEQAANEQGAITFTSLFGYLRAAMPADQEPRFFGSGGELLLATHAHLSAQRRREREQQARRNERKRWLRALAADHSGFLDDRLNSLVGREHELEEVRQQVQELVPTGGYLAITGVAGQGKSSLIARLVQEAAQEQDGRERVMYHFIPPTPGAGYQAVLLRTLMARLILKYQLPDVLEEYASTATLSAGFHWMLSHLAEQGKTEIIFIDGLDQLQPDQPTGWRDLSFLPQGTDGPPPGIVFVLGTRPDDTRRPLDALKPFREYPLPGLSRSDFTQVLHRRGVTLEAGQADRLYEVLNENALYLDQVAQELAKRPALTAEEVEQIVRQVAEDPENLFSLAIERLRGQQGIWEAVAKPILGLLSVTREPLRRDHLKRLLTLDAARPIDGEQVDRGLQGLGGLLVRDNQERYSVYHLKLRAYLLQDIQQPQKKYLFDCDDQQRLHGRFVAWCESHDLKEIWEDTPLDSEQERRGYARQHYVEHLSEAGQWEKLFKVLDEGEYGRAKVASDPSTRLYALDLDLGR